MGIYLNKDEEDFNYLILKGDNLNKLEYFLISVFTASDNLPRTLIQLTKDCISIENYISNYSVDIYFSYDRILGVRVSGKHGGYVTSDKTFISEDIAKYELINNSTRYSKEISMESFSDGFLDKIHEHILSLRKSYDDYFMGITIDCMMENSGLNRNYNIDRVVTESKH